MKLKEIDTQELAYIDVTTPAYALATDGVITPGLRLLNDAYESEKKSFDLRLANTASDLQIKQDALDTALAHALPNISSEKDTLISAHNAQQTALQGKFDTANEELSHLQKMESVLGIRYRQFEPKALENTLNVSQIPEAKNASDTSSKYKNTGWLVLLVGICAFDAMNAFQALTNFENNPVLITAVSLICFGLVLASALWVKQSPSKTTWAWFILFLCFANLPLIYGKSPLFDISRLWLSPFALTRFLISFIGSLFITFKMMGKKVADVQATEMQPFPVPDIQIDPNRKKWEMLVLKIKEKLASIETLKTEMIALETGFDANIAGLDKMVEEHAALKLQAIETLRSELAAFENQKEKLETDIKNLDSLFQQKQQEYHAEMELLRLIHGIK